MKPTILLQQRNPPPLQLYVCSLQTIIVARTDAEAATLLDNNVDPRDHPFILGATVPGTR